MPSVEDLNPEHEEYLQELRKGLMDAGFVVEEYGYETRLAAFKETGLASDFSPRGLHLRSSPDTIVRHPVTGFTFAIDGKTTLFRKDTGKVAVEVWPVVCFQDYRHKGTDVPHLLAFRSADAGVWIDLLRLAAWCPTVMMPDRWTDDQIEEFRIHLYYHLKFDPEIVRCHTDPQRSSGDPFFLWPISWFVGKTPIAMAVERARYNESQYALEEFLPQHRPAALRERV